jgi:hypothetical protein
MTPVVRQNRMPKAREVMALNVTKIATKSNVTSGGSKGIAASFLALISSTLFI